MLTAMYYLFVGAIANYFAAQLAKFTAVPDNGGTIKNLSIVAMQYKNTYLEVFYVGIIMIIGLILLRVFLWVNLNQPVDISIL
jgi:hypothetical protein